MNVSGITAIHEAAHAVALHDELGLAMPPEALAVVLLAGPCAEAKFRRLRFDRVLAGEAAMDDRDSISALGLSDAQFIAASRDALALIESDWTAIERVANALTRAGWLEFEEVVALVEPAHEP